MQEVGELHQTMGESDAPADSALGLDGPGLSSGKSKKRERPDPSTTTDIRDQFIDEYTSPQKRECVENFVDDGGGLANNAAVDQLLLKMKQEKCSSLQRSRAAKILVATTKDDCLQKFVLSGGVSILKEWIQEGSNNRYSDAGTKDVDKDFDEEMMVILQALEKLPISLETLKGCSIGKSVKQLRSVRNGEIQKRARKLVDAWRKRVDLEMKQSSTLPEVAPPQVDSVSCASDISPINDMEVINQLAVQAGSSTHSQEINATIKAQNLVSTFSTAATLDAASNEHSKTAISAEKDASKKTARLSTSSTTSASSLSPAKKQKHSSLDKDFKDEGLNSLDCQKLKERDLKCDKSSSHADTAVKKTNEYRKKLRSGGTSTAPCSTDSHANTSPSNGIQTRGNNHEKVACMDSNMGELEQQQVELCNVSLDMKRPNTPTGNEAPDPPRKSEKNVGNKDVVATNPHPQDGKMDFVNGSCLSSQSSCTDKQPKVVSMVGRTSSQVSPLQDTATYELSPKVEPNPSSASMANAICERKESANATRVREVRALDREESCCSHSTQQAGHVCGAAAATQHDENVQQKPPEYSPIRLADYEGACMLDGAACSESRKFLVHSCQDTPRNDASNTALAPSPAANGNSVSNLTSELDKAEVRASEIPAVTHSCHDFDLNEGLAMDEFMQDTQPSCGPPSTSTSSFQMKVTGTLSAPIAVSAATKGAFIPPLNAPCKSDIGWRGSAATSAFRPAEPRHASAKTQPIQASSKTEARNVNCFDLNVADGEALEDCPSLFGGWKQGLDLNYDGREIQSRNSISDSATHLRAGIPGKLPEKRALLDFDLNEQLDEAPPEREVLSSSAARSYGGPISFGGLSGPAACGEVASWASAEGTSYQGGSANGPRFELFSSGYASQPAVSSRQVTPTSIVPPPLSSVVYSQTAPFFGGPTPASFPASFTYNPMPVGPDASYMVSKAMPGIAASSVGVRSRAEMSGRPAFLTSIDDLRGGNNVYTWGRAPQSIYGNSGPTIISYNDAAIGGREHAVGYDGNASLEEQMRLFQQAAVPVSSLKRRDAEYFPGLKLTSWH